MGQCNLLYFLVRRDAWKEKITLFILYILITAFFCIWLEFVTTLFCDPPKTFEFGDVYSNSSHYSSVHGQVFDWKKYGNSTEMTTQANLYPHLDLSPMFPTFMLLKRPNGQSYYEDSVIENCINGFNRSTQADNWLKYLLNHDSGYHFEKDQLISCPIPGRRNITGAPCFYSQADIHQFNQYPKKGGKACRCHFLILHHLHFFVQLSVLTRIMFITTALLCLIKAYLMEEPM